MNTLALAVIIAVGGTVYLVAAVASAIWGMDHRHPIIGAAPLLLLFASFLFCVAMLALTGGES